MITDYDIQYEYYKYILLNSTNDITSNNFIIDYVPGQYYSLGIINNFSVKNKDVQNAWFAFSSFRL